MMLTDLIKIYSKLKSHRKEKWLKKQKLMLKVALMSGCIKRMK
jgi:hypothetical protein